MNREAIRKSLAKILENELGLQSDALYDQVSLREGLGLDSVDFVSVISQVERQYKIQFSQEELGTLNTVGGLLDLMEKKVRSKGTEAA